MAKIRVYELARELNKESKDIIALLQERGIEAKNVSCVDDGIAQMIRREVSELAAKADTPEQGKPAFDENKPDEIETTKPQESASSDGAVSECTKPQEDVPEPTETQEDNTPSSEDITVNDIDTAKWNDAENEESESPYFPHVISFVGNGKPDLPYYVALFLKGAGKKVLLIDNTREQYLYSAISDRNGCDDQIMIYLPDMFVASNTIVDKANNIDVFDVIVQIWGDNYENYRKISEDEFTFIESCYNTQKDKKLKMFVSMHEQDFESAKVSLIFRDKVGKHFNEKTLESEYGLNEIAARYIIPADTQDLYSYQILLAQGMINFRKADLSGGLYNAVIDIASMLYEIDDKELKRIENKLLKETKKNKRNGGQK